MSTPTRESRGLGWRLGGIGAGISVLLLIVLLLFDQSTQQPEEPNNAEVTELIAPKPLDRNDGTAGGLTDPNLSVLLPEGGWLQVAGPDGQLAQQYRFTHLDPNPSDLPTNWIQMRDPELELFMGGGRLVTLAGREADAYAPRRELEEGRLIGDVVIRMFEQVRGGYADPSVDPPALTIRTDAAAFDNLSGRITCEGHLDITTPTEHMVGRGLQLLLNDRDNRIEYMEIASLDYLLLRDVSQHANAKRRTHIVRRKLPTARVIPVAMGQDAAPTFYRLTLHDQVRITQAPAQSTRNALPRIATADDLHVIFSFESGAFGSQKPPATASVPLSPPLLMCAMAIGMTPPQPAPQEVLVTCQGPLTMVPLEDDEDRPANAKDTRLELVGTPTQIFDANEGIAASCDQITWNSADERFDLTSTSPQQVVITTDDLTLHSTHAWARPDAGLGGINGAGTAILVDVSQQSSATPTSAEATTITWTEKVDLEFEPADASEQGLRSIRFLQTVLVQSPDGTISAEDLQMRFKPGPDGKAIPDRLIGNGGVRASNAGQVLWTDELLATLEPTGTQQSDETQSFEVRDVLATGNVQIRMKDGGRAWADQLKGDAAQESVELLGKNVTVSRGEVIMEHGTSLRLDRLAGTADWPGPGRALMLKNPPIPPDDSRAPRPQTPEVLGKEDSKITWGSSLHIEFDANAEQEDAAMRSITFNGDVAVLSPDGTIAAEALTMEFVPDQTGRAAPDRLVCEQRVRAHSDGQTLWADHLVAILGPAEEAEQDTQDTSIGGNITLRDFEATGDVQVLMKDGGRGFADTLVGDAAQETVRLTGMEVLIARQDVLIDRGQDLRIDRLAGTADWVGSGRSRMLADPLKLDMDSRIPLPRVVGRPGDPRVTMRTTWNTSLHYDSFFADGAGAMDLVGNVDSVVDRSEVQRSSLQGDSVRLEFVRIEQLAQEAPTGDDPFAAGSRALHRLIARGHARLESRTWESQARKKLPRVFYVGAEHITWNDLDTEAIIIGDGDIVIREPAWAAGKSGKPESGGPFSGPGTSRFVWSERLDLLHEADDRFHMTMVGDVEGLWKSASRDHDIATITADQVAVLTRRGETEVRTDAPLQLGGDMEVDRLRAMGRVYLSTPTRRVDCHQLDYNTRTNIAELIARAGRTVSVITEGAPMPVQATRMSWNMDPAIDTITLEKPRGSGAP